MRLIILAIVSGLFTYAQSITMASTKGLFFLSDDDSMTATITNLPNGFSLFYMADQESMLHCVALSQVFDIANMGDNIRDLINKIEKEQGMCIEYKAIKKR